MFEYTTIVRARLNLMAINPMEKKAIIGGRYCYSNWYPHGMTCITMCTGQCDVSEHLRLHYGEQTLDIKEYLATFQ